MSKLLNEELKFDGPRFKVYRKEYERDDGLKYIRDCVEPGNAVVILPVTENNEIVFVKEEREVIGKISMGLPAGMIEDNEEPMDAAKRELAEETGIQSNELEFLISYFPSCGYTSEKIYIYLARNFTYGKQHFDETEEILSVEKIKLEDCMQMINENKFEHASVNIAILLYYYKYCNGGINGSNKTNDNINRFE